MVCTRAGSKWGSLTASVYVMIAAGTVYSFGIYSQQLKDGPAALNQSEVCVYVRVCGSRASVCVRACPCVHVHMHLPTRVHA